LNKAELARDVGISPSTAGQWLSVLEASNQIVLLEPWFSNRTKSLVKTPKLYLGDTGLLCHLLGIRSVDELLASPYAGAVWETMAFGELRRQIKNTRRSGDLFFWRDRAREVDFLLHRGGHFELYEAKWTERPSARDVSHLRRVTAELPQGSVSRAAVLCRAPTSFPLQDGLWALPLDALDPAAEK
jgi:predicted AAA+ superfamily ATPase